MPICQILTSGTTTVCLDGIGGIQQVYLASYDAVSASTISAVNQVTSLTMVSPYKFYEFKLLKNGATFEENPVPNPENGTLYFSGKLSFKVSKRSTQNRNVIDMLTPQKLVAIVYEKTGTYWVIGLQAGLRLLPDTKGNSGTKPDDFNGMELVLGSEEKYLSYEITPAAVAAVI